MSVQGGRVLSVARRHGALAVLVLAAVPLAARAAQPARLRMARADSAGRDSLVMLHDVIVNGDAFARMIRELIASKEMEQTIGNALREASTGQKADARKVELLRSQLGEIARRNAGLITSIQMQCVDEGPMPDGYLGVQFDQQSISQRDNEPALFELGSIDSVTPGSPAEKAGIRRGDVLLSIGGVDARKPIALGPILKPGAKVVIRLQRGTSTREVTALVEKRPKSMDPDCSSAAQLVRPDRDGLPLMIFRQGPGSAPRAARASEPGAPPDAPPPPSAGGYGYAFTPMAMPSGLLGGAQMRTLDDDWRASLGVDNGLLVISVAPGTPAREAGLRGSDVIIRADGESVSSIGALRRIVSEAKSNAVKLEIIRAGKTQALVLRWR